MASAFSGPARRFSIWVAGDISGRAFLGEVEAGARIGRRLQPYIEFANRQFALEPVPFFAIANPFIQRRQEIKSDVGGLKVGGVRVRDVVG